MLNRKNIWVLALTLVVFSFLLGCHDRTPVEPEIDNMAELGRGIHVSPSQFFPQGVDSLTLNTGDTMNVIIESILLQDPNYSFTAGDNQILDVVPDNEDPELFHFVALGDSGTFTTLEIIDTVNQARREIKVGISDHYADPIWFTFIGTFEGHYYYISNDIKSWVPAKEFCEEAGGYMAVINSLDENILLDRGRGQHENVWIGLRFNPTGEEDDWVLDTWVNGDSLDYENFRSKPSNPGIFAEYYFHMDSEGDWENWHEISYPYFLEME